MRALMWVMWLCGLLLAGCQALLVTPEPFPSETPTPTLTPTATIQWFPPTPTATAGAPRLSPQPTPDRLPGLGALVLRDDFTSAAAWQTFATSGGSAGVARGALTLAAPEAAANLVSLRREPVPDNFYLEISTAAALCRGQDSYGVVFRADGAASQYRLWVSCEGLLRVERWLPAEVSVIQNWTPSGQIPRAGLQPLRLGVWMVDSEMRIFVDGVFQFALRDPLVRGQQIGVALRTTGANAATVNFSNLVIRRIEGYVPSPIPSATPVITIAATRAPTFTPTAATSAPAP